jgi:hypothetical protein
VLPLIQSTDAAEPEREVYGAIFHRLVDYAKLRWRIEYDYMKLKQEVRLGDCEGHGWRVPACRHDVNRGLWLPDLREGSFSASASIIKVLFPELALPKGYRPIPGQAKSRG